MERYEELKSPTEPRSLSSAKPRSFATVSAQSFFNSVHVSAAKGVTARPQAQCCRFSLGSFQPLDLTSSSTADLSAQNLGP